MLANFEYRYWILDTGYWILDAGGYCMLDTRHWTVWVGCWMRVGCWMLLVVVYIVVDTLLYLHLSCYSFNFTFFIFQILLFFR